MNEEVLKKIEEIKPTVNCQKGFRCEKMPFENICKARDMGSTRFLECLEPEGSQCSFARSFGHGYLCYCPLRMVLAKELMK